MNDLDRFWAKVDKSGDCWLWTAGCSGDGYGSFKWHGKQWAAHRLSYLIHYADPGDLQVRHTCDTPLCVRPSHLVLGTVRDNMRDKSERKRIHADRNPNAKLTWEKVREIRSLYPKLNQPQLAEMFGVKTVAINRVIREITWKE